MSAASTNVRRPMLLAALLLSALLVGLVAGNALPESPEADAGVLTTDLDDQPSDTTSNAPVFSRDEAGATSFAVWVSTSLSQVLMYMEPEQAGDSVRDVSADDTADLNAANAVERFSEAHAVLGDGNGELWWALSPLAARVERFNVDEARVAVWLVRVLSRDGVVEPQAWWSTHTVDVVWEDGQWRVASFADVTGPTPGNQDTPSTASELESSLAGFQLVGHR